MTGIRTDPDAFERRYRDEPDPWGYASRAYEQAKYARTLAAIGPGPFERALELGCSIGVFTAQLAPRCRALVAVDAAPTALAAARERLRDAPHVRIEQRTLPEQLPGGPFDLVVASELLYYLSEPLLCEALDRVEDALTPGGRLVAVHWRGEIRDGPLDAARVHALLRARPALRHLRDDDGEDQEQDPAFLLDRFERVAAQTGVALDGAAPDPGPAPTVTARPVDGAGRQPAPESASA